VDTLRTKRTERITWITADLVHSGIQKPPTGKKQAAERKKGLSAVSARPAAAASEKNNKPTIHSLTTGG
jgi:hypothetical protein